MIDFENDFTMTVNGAECVSERQFDVVNPATEGLVAKAPDVSREQLDAAVHAAREAFPAWRDTPLPARRAACAAIGDAIAAHADSFARLLTLEQGRPLAQAMSEVQFTVYWIQEAAKQEIPFVVNEDTRERRSETRYVPLGVVGAILPWNFPLLLGIWKIAPALLTGNCVVVKPSPYTPLTMLKLGELVRGLVPAGVFSVISGGDALGPWMTEHPGIDKIAFTGSSATGRRVMASGAATLKRITLELGGNDAAIVLPDADVKAIAPQLFRLAFFNSGQVCNAVKRMYVHSDIYDALAAELVACAENAKLGDGLKEGTDIGPLQNRKQFERVRDLIADARQTGLRFLTGGTVPEGKGYFVPITIIDNPPEDSRVVVEEAFGPVLPLLKFNDIDDVVRRANSSNYGLAGSIWTSDPERGAALAHRLETGTVWVNETQYVMPWIPFGGHKQSGIGVENGADGLLEYTNAQTISIKLS